MIFYIVTFAGQEPPQKSEYKNKEIFQTISEIELINLIEYELGNPSYRVLDMNQINITYRNLLCENGLYINEVNYKYKT